MGSDGVNRLVYKRRTYYRCDVGPGGGGRLRQPRLSFRRPDLRTRRLDTNQGELGISASTEGQNDQTVREVLRK